MTSLLSRQFQTSLLAAMLSDASLLHDARDCITLESFQDKTEQTFAESVLKHYDRYGCAPTEQTTHDILRDVGLDVEERDALLDRLTESKSDPRWVRDKIVEHYQAVRINGTIETVAEMLGRGDSMEKIRAELLSVATIGNRTDSPAAFWEDDVAERLKRYKDQAENPLAFGRMGTGIGFLDENMNGGLGPGELGAILARPNGGKSTVLVNFGKRAVLAGFRVSHFTFEMSRDSTLRRYDMSFTGLTKRELSERQKTAYERLMQVATQQAYRRLTVKEYPTGSAGPAEIEAQLRLSSARDGFTPNLVIVDYAALMASPSQQEQYRHTLAATFRHLRAIGGQRKIPIWTAHQTNRNGLENELLGLGDLSECFEIGAICDVIIGLNRTLKEERDGIGRINLIRNREDRANVIGTVSMDFQTCDVREITA